MKRDTVVAYVRIIIISVIVGFVLGVARANAEPLPVITVDGVEYTATKVVGNGNTVHFETPDVNPTSAFTVRNTWTGNGSDNLPCEGGIHWIDNKNRLVISHCLEQTETTTTTTVVEESSTTSSTLTTSTTMMGSTTTLGVTTTVERMTTSSEQEDTSTTYEDKTSTTTAFSTTSSTPSSSSTTTPTSGEELPVTGLSMFFYVLFGSLLVALGISALRMAFEDDGEDDLE